MIDKYVVRPGVKLPEMADYPAKGVLANSEWRDQVFKAAVIKAIDVLSEKIGVVDVVCKAKPSRGVFADAKFKASECVLVPVTAKIKIVNEEESDSIFSCEGDAPDGKVLELMSSATTDMPVPAWFCATTSDEKSATMKVSMVKVEVGASTAKKGKAQSVNATSYTVICIPVLVNIKGLQPGDELIYFRAPKAQGTKRPFDLI